MPRKSPSLLVIMLVLLICASPSAQAQEQDREQSTERVFQLLRPSALSVEEELDLADETEQAFWEPTIRKGNLELTFFLGSLNLDQVLLAHDEIIYKYTDENTYWGDVAFKGEASAFSPALRLNYNVNRFFAVEGITNFTTCGYQTTITDRVVRTNGDNPVVGESEPALSEFDGERRSLVAFLASLNAVVYPLNFAGERVGRWQPYLSGGLGKMWYNMNSDYVAGTTDTGNTSLACGVRFLAERSISARFEIAYLNHELQWTPADYFKSLNEGTKLINVYEYSTSPTDPEIVTSYEPQTIKTIQMSLGFQASF